MLFKKKKASERELDMARIPRHIGVIMDGNGRWAAKRGLPRSVGHRAGVDALERTTEYCDSLGVKALTAYVFSTENWSRPKKEVDYIMDLFADYLAHSEERLGGRNVRIRVVGDKSVFDEKMLTLIEKTEEQTGKNTGIMLNLAVNYGGRREIALAAKRLAEDYRAGRASEFTEERLSEYIYLPDYPDADFIIRPSGELRLSNFMLWQAAYAELWFCDVLWPDFSEAHMRGAILDYQARDRRFGGVR